MTYLEVSIASIAVVFLIFGFVRIKKRKRNNPEITVRSTQGIKIILKTGLTVLIILVAISFFIYERSDVPAMDGKSVATTTIPLSRDYQLDQCRTCDNNGCTDSRTYSRINVDKISKKYDLFSIAPDGSETKSQKNVSESCQFEGAEDDPFSFACQSSVRYGKSNGTLSIRFGNQRLTIEKEYPISGRSEYFHSSTTCPVISPWM